MVLGPAEVTPAQRPLSGEGRNGAVPALCRQLLGVFHEGEMLALLPC